MKEEIVPCRTWNGFKTKIEKLIKDSPRRGGEHKNGYDHFRFRGHGDAGWKLKTSLERIKGKEKVTVSEYRRNMEGINSEIKSFTNQTFESKGFSDKIEDRHYFSDEEFIYMVYLRQNGYPSPLLDWTVSPYIASYFAFKCKPKEKVKNVAVYAYQQKVQPPSFVTSSVGWTIPTDKKHFLQGAEYTYCVDDASENAFFANHEDALKKDNRCKDRLIKYTIPVSQREKVLYDLSLYNINEYTLFQTEESLMKKLEIDEFVILSKK